MIDILKKILNLFDKNQKRKVYILQFFNVMISITEIITLGTLAIFIASLANLEFMLNNKYLMFIYDYCDFKNQYDFLLFLGIIVLFLYIFVGILNIIITWKSNFLAIKINQQLSNLIIKNYVFKNWHEFTKLKISNIYKDVFTDLNIVSSNIIVPIFNLFNKLFIAFALTLTLIIYNFKVAIIGITIYSSIYFLLILFVKKVTLKITKNISKNRNKNHAFIHNFFSGFKEVIIFNLRRLYFEKIKKNNEDMIYPTTYLISLSQIPRFFVELVSYIVIISGILFIIYRGDNLDNLLPMVAIYAFAGLKLLPAFQQIYLAYVRIKAGHVALNNIYPKIVSAKKKKIFFEEKTNKKLNFKNNITFKNVIFKYDIKSKKASVKKLNLKIYKNSIVGFSGPSGSGKSTIIDIISGLLSPQKGQILVDDQILDKSKLRQWQNNFGIVTQMPYLSSDRINDNISFGKIKGNIDKKKIDDLIKKVELERFIKSRKEGIKSKISDRGINISGGERQRIAIARSLYFDNDIIIFDEATNALDKITEKKIIKFIKALSKHKTIIIITHRTNTLKICKNIYLVNEGSIINSGTYKFLQKKSSIFRKLITND